MSTDSTRLIKISFPNESISKMRFHKLNYRIVQEYCFLLRTKRKMAKGLVRQRPYYCFIESQNRLTIIKLCFLNGIFRSTYFQDMTVLTCKQQYCICHRLEAYVTLDIFSKTNDQSSVVYNHFKQQTDKLTTAISWSEQAMELLLIVRGMPCPDCLPAGVNPNRESEETVRSPSVL